MKIKNFGQYINETKIVDKDWMRMSDLILSDNDGESVAKSIKDKDKAIARYIAGIKLEGENINYDEKWKKFIGSFSDFGNRALQLGATIEEIKNAYDETVIPEKFTDKIKKLASKKLNDRFVGDISKKILDAGFDINFLHHNGNALTMEGKDAMRRNGRKWTIGYKTEIDINGEKIKLSFDAITDEGDGPTFYIIDTYNSDKIFHGLTWDPIGKLAFISKIMKILNK